MATNIRNDMQAAEWENVHFTKKFSSVAQALCIHGKHWWWFSMHFLDPILILFYKTEREKLKTFNKINRIHAIFKNRNDQNKNLMDSS